MRVKVLQTGAHAPWQEGEIVTVQVAAVDDAGAYECETLDTYPADLKDRHAETLARQQSQHENLMAELTERHDAALASHAVQVQRLQDQLDGYKTGTKG